jgi:hypothetical protein
MSGKEVLKIEDISYIFSNCELILEQHQIILEQLQKIEANDWPLVRGVGKVILDGRKGLTNYGVYVGNYVNGQDNIRRLRADKNGKVNLWLQEIEAKAEHVSLALLSAPLTHISNIENALRQMCEFVPLEEERELNAAFSLIHETEKFVTVHLSQSETNSVLTNLQRRITHDKPLDLVKDDRRLLLESQFLVSGHKRTFVLCSDLLIVGKPTKGNNFQLKEMRSLEVVQFEAIPGADNSLIIKSPTAVYKVTGKPEDCSQWLALLSEYEESNKWNRTIGIGIPAILKRENNPDGIPSIVTQCIDHLRSLDGGIQTEGLFRISGEHKQIFDQRK